MADGDRLQQIGLGLQGFSAGVSGQLPQFQNQLANMQQIAQQEEQDRAEQQRLQQEQMQKMLQERQKTMYQDFAIAGQLLDSDPMRAEDLLMNRLQASQQIPGMDVSDTQTLAQLVTLYNAGDEEAGNQAKSLIDTYLMEGQARGMYAPPKVPDAKTDLGKISSDEAAGLITPEQAQSLRTSAMAPAAQSSDQRERKIQEYMQIGGISRAEATSRVDSQFTTDPQGNAIVYDPVTNKIRYANAESPGEPIQLGEPVDVELEDLAFDPATGTGLGSSLIGLYNSTLGQVPILPTFLGPEEAAQNLTVLGRDAVKALASAPSRPPVIEQQAIMAMMPAPMSPFENPTIAQEKVKGFVDLMMQQYVSDVKAYSDPTNPKNVKDQSRQRANQIEGIVNRVLTPDAADTMFRSVNNTLGGGRFSQMTPEELREVDIDSLNTIEELNEFNAALDAIQ